MASTAEIPKHSTNGCQCGKSRFLSDKHVPSRWGGQSVRGKGRSPSAVPTLRYQRTADEDCSHEVCHHQGCEFHKGPSHRIGAQFAGGPGTQSRKSCAISMLTLDRPSRRGEKIPSRQHYLRVSIPSPSHNLSHSSLFFPTCRITSSNPRNPQF